MDKHGYGFQSLLRLTACTAFALVIASCDRSEKSADSEGEKSHVGKSAKLESRKSDNVSSMLAMTSELNLRDRKQASSKISDMRQKLAGYERDDLVAVALGADQRTSEGKLTAAAALECLALKDPQECLRIFGERCKENSYLLSEIFSNLLKTDRFAVFEWLRDPNNKNRNPQAIGTVSWIFAASHPEEAWTVLALANSSEERVKVLHSLASELVSQDFVKAASQFDSNLKGDERDQAYYRLVAMKAGNNPLECFDLIKRINSAESRKNATREVFSALFTSDPSTGAELLKSLDARDTGDLLQNWSLLAKIGEFDVAALENASLKVVPSQANAATFKKIAEELALRNPDRLASWTAEFPQGEFQSDLYKVSFEQISKRDPKLAISKLETLSLDSKLVAIEGISSGWPSSDSGSLFSWAQALGPDQRQAALRSGLQNVLQNDPDQIHSMAAPVAEAVSQMADHDRETLLSSAAQTFFASGSAKAIQWFDKLPNGLQASAAPGLTSAYVSSDPQAAANWVASIKDADTRRAAMGVMADALRYTDPEAAERWRSESLRGQ